MASILTSAQELQAKNLLDTAFDTFKAKNKLKICKAGENVLMGETPPDFNFIFGNNNKNIVTNIEPVCAEFDATIEDLAQLGEQDLKKFVSDARFVQGRGVTRISIKIEAFDWIKDQKEVSYNGQKYNLISDIQKRGLFQADYCDFWLQKAD